MSKSDVVFIIGGCRSGKSRYALEYAEKGRQKVFIATLQVKDEEMAERVKRHRKSRGKDWATVEEPLNIGDALKDNRNNADVIVIDCLTLWITNLMLAEKTADDILTETDKLCSILNECSCSVVLVSNEVGNGIVPDNKLARDFRDIAGMVNQKVASACITVIRMSAGIPQVIKGT